MTLRTLCVAVLLAGALPCPAQTIQLSDGQVLLASVEDVDGQGLRVRRLDNGGVLDLRWEHLSADSAQRIKAAHDLGGQTQDEVMVTADLVKYKLNGTPTEVIGRIVDRTPTHIIMLRKGVQVQVPKDAGLLIQTVEVPALQVFTKDEYYGKRLNDVQPGESADKHMQLAQEMIKVRDYDHAREHLEAAQKLNNSKDPNQITILMKKLELYREAQAERDLLDQIQASRARNEFEKGLGLIAKYKEQYGKGKLRAEFETEEKRFGEARKKVLTGKVADQWRRIIRSTAERKVLEVGITLAQAQEYATSKMADDICGRVAQQLQLTPEETRTLWNERAKYAAGKHPELFTYGLGSWVLGETAILKDTKQGKENAKQAPKDAANDRDIERINKLIQAARARSAKANTGEKEATPEDWWSGADTSQRAGWLRAFYAESSGTMVLTAAYLQDCPTCAGEGSLPEVVSGKVVKQPCYLCQGTRYLRSFNAY